MEKLGKWAFVAGLALCLIAAFFWELVVFAWVLVVLGIIIGLLNVQESETQRFLLAAIAVTVAASGLQEIPYLGTWLSKVFEYFVVLIGPAAVVVAVRSLFQTAAD